MSRTETIRPATLVTAGAWEAVGADPVVAMSDGVPSGPGRFDPSAVNYISGSRATGPIVFDLADLAANLTAGEWIESVTIRTLYARTVSADPFTLTHRASWDAGAGRVNASSAQPSFPQSWALGAKLNQSVVSIAARPQGDGFWLVAGDGGVFAVGAARFLGSGVGVVDTTVRDIAAHPSGNGYYLLADSGSVYAYGCQHYGSQTGGGYIAIVPTNTGNGYWLITTTGFIQPYGDAVAYDAVPVTTGHVAVGAAGDPRANGLWIADSDGAVFARGNAGYHGGAGAETLAAPITGIAAHSSGLGYWLVGEDGGIFAYGAAPYRGNVVDVISSHAGTKAVDLFGFSAQGYWVAVDDGKVIAVDPDARETRLTLTRGSGDHGSVAESDAESLQVSYEVSKAGGSLAGAPLILLDIAADVLVNTKPTATISAPVGTVTTTSAPTVQLTYGDVDGDPHSHTRAMFLDGAELDAAATAAGKTVAGVLAGLEPDDTMPATVLADSGELIGGKVEWTPPALDNGRDMYVVAWVGHATPRWPDGRVVWSEPDVEGVTLDLQAPAPAAGTIDIDSTLQRYTLALQGHDNLATSDESQGLGGWEVRENSQPLTYAPAGVTMEAATDGTVAMSFDTPATEGPMTVMVTVETAQPENVATLRPVEILVELLDDAGLLVGTLHVGPETLQRKRADEPEPPPPGSVVYHELVYYASETRTSPTPVPSNGSLTLGDDETKAWFSIRPKAGETVPAGWVLERFASWDPGVDNFRVPTWVDAALVPAGYERGAPTGEWYASTLDPETVPPDAGTIDDPAGWPDYWGGNSTRAFAMPVTKLPVGTYAEGSTRPPLYAEASFRAADGKLHTERYRAPFEVVSTPDTGVAGDQTGDTTFLEPAKAGYLWRLSGSAFPWDLRLGKYSINYAEGSPPNNYEQESRSTPQGTRPVMISVHEGNLESRYGVDIRCRFENMGLGRYDELYFRYYRRVPTGFIFSQGKEPGLQGKVLGGSEWWPATTGFSGQHDYRQFSARTMFKGTGMITYANAAQWNGRWHEDNTTSSGTMYSFSYRYEKPWGSGDRTFILVDTWHSFEQRVKLNDVGSDNGVFEGWVDDVLSYRSTRVRWRGTSSTQGVSTADAENIKIDQLNGVQFYGGPTSDYPTSPTKIDYDDFVISTQPIGLRA